MSDCISLIDSRADPAKVAQWVQVSQMTNVVHTEEVRIVSAASGYLEIETYCIPDLDCRIVGYAIYHCCGTGKIHSYTPEVISHITQFGPDTCVKLDCWELNPKQKSNEPEFCWIDDPCQRLRELRCCQMEWLKAGKKKSWSFRDSSGSTSYLSEAWFKEMINQAQSECDAQKCGNSRVATYRCNSGYC